MTTFRVLALLPLLVLATGGCTSMKSLYQQERRDALHEYADPLTQEPITEEDLARLPDPVQRFFRQAGYLGHPKMINAQVVWAHSEIRMSPDRNGRMPGTVGPGPVSGTGAWRPPAPSSSTRQEISSGSRPWTGTTRGPTEDTRR